MVREYTENYYVPAATELAGRIAANGEIGTIIERWRQRIADNWPALHFGSLGVSQSDSALTFDVQVYLGEISPTDVQVEIWADRLTENARLSKRWSRSPDWWVRSTG